MINKKTKILGYDVLSNGIDFKSLLKNKNEVITCINPEAYLQAKKDDLFRKALLNSNHLLVDGVGIKMAANWIYNKKMLFHKLHTFFKLCFTHVILLIKRV